jgi:hypothetical protein
VVPGWLVAYPAQFELVVAHVEARAPVGGARATSAAMSVTERAIRRATFDRIAPQAKSNLRDR